MQFSDILDVPLFWQGSEEWQEVIGREKLDEIGIWLQDGLQPTELPIYKQTTSYQPLFSPAVSYPSFFPQANW